jgi:hypothetical protein
LTIHTDVTNTPDVDLMGEAATESAAVDRLMKGLRPSNTDDDEDDEDGEDAPIDTDDEDADEDEDDDQDEDDAPEDEDAAEPKPEGAEAYAPDTAKVKVTVDGVETEFTVANLKRLAGQEASLTRKSQDADVVGGRAAAALQAALYAVDEDLSAYEGVDWTLEATRMDPNEFAWQRSNFTRLMGKREQVIGAAQGFQTAVQGRQQNISEDAVREAVGELTADIPNWSDSLYGSIMDYAVKQGLDANDVSQITNAKIIKLLHKAMSHDTAKATVARSKPLAQPTVNKVARRAPPGAGSPTARTTQAEKALSRGNVSVDDGVAILMGRWGAKGRRA